ncbi:MAG TPA: gluconate 2-dehydrogenase subunit 3 family protein [Chitinophagaceae bacterium]|nr:gluconate 2-dehydrogenase subunit 3 family protein [Chitinophagaceae bacterium]
MQRRVALKNILLFTGGTMLFPSCLQQDKKASIPLQKLKVSADQEALLAEVAETIIPKTDTPGAKDLGVHQFVLVMMDDCYEKEDQDKFLNGLSELDKLSKKHYSNSFIKANSQQRQQLLTRIDRKEFEGDVSSFFSAMKQLTVQGFMKSQYVMTNLIVYELVPGRFSGSFPVKDKKRFQQHG